MVSLSITYLRRLSCCSLLYLYICYIDACIRDKDDYHIGFDRLASIDGQPSGLLDENGVVRRRAQLSHTRRGSRYEFITDTHSNGSLPATMLTPYPII